MQELNQKEVKAGLADWKPVKASEEKSRKKKDEMAAGSLQDRREAQPGRGSSCMEPLHSSLVTPQLE